MAISLSSLSGPLMDSSPLTAISTTTTSPSSLEAARAASLSSGHSGLSGPLMVAMDSSPQTATSPLTMGSSPQQARTAMQVCSHGLCCLLEFALSVLTEMHSCMHASFNICACL